MPVLRHADSRESDTVPELYFAINEVAGLFAGKTYLANSKRDSPIYANIGFSEIPGLKAGDFLFHFFFFTKPL
jgi:hypothetical protein